jgi:hypothetical protein
MGQLVAGPAGYRYAAFVVESRLRDVNTASPELGSVSKNHTREV